MDKLCRLLLNGTDHSRMDVAQYVGRDTSHQVNVVSAARVPDSHALAALQYQAALESVLIILLLKGGPVALLSCGRLRGRGHASLLLPIMQVYGSLGSLSPTVHRHGDLEMSVASTRCCGRSTLRLARVCGVLFNVAVRQVAAPGCCLIRAIAQRDFNGDVHW